MQLDLFVRFVFLVILFVFAMNFVPPELRHYCMEQISEKEKNLSPPLLRDGGEGFK